MRSERRVNNLAFVDMLLLLLIVALALISPPQPGELEPRPEAMITTEWREDAKSDVDIWILTPTGEKVGYIGKDKGHITLVRDDTGALSGIGNHESVEIYELKDGQYVVNLHMFHKRDYDGPVPVTVEFVTFDKYHKHVHMVVELHAQNQEITCFTFEVKDGKIVDIDYDAKIKIYGGFYGDYDD